VADRSDVGAVSRATHCDRAVRVHVEGPDEYQGTGDAGQAAVAPLDCPDVPYRATLGGHVPRTGAAARAVVGVVDVWASYVRDSTEPEDPFVVIADPEGNELGICPVDDERQDGSSGG
jgi:hypothetical protein